MQVGRLGTDYKHSTLKEIEAVYFNRNDVEAFVHETVKKYNIHGLAMVFTCNRGEIYFTADQEEPATEELFQAIAEYKNLPVSTVKRILRPDFGQSVVEHLCHVASGTQSMVFGENEILTQVKQAHQISSERKACDAMLNKVFLTAITAGKRVRSETNINQGSHSISSIAIEAFRKRHPNFQKKSVLVIGAGTMGLRVIKKLSSLGHPNLTICNRTEDKLSRICERYNISHLRYKDMWPKLGEFDVVFWATSAKEPLLTPETVPDTQHDKQLLIDLGLPRNVSPEMATTAGYELIGLESFEEIASENIQNRKQALPHVKIIIQEELDRLAHWVSYRNGVKLSY